MKMSPARSELISLYTNFRASPSTTLTENDICRSLILNDSNAMELDALSNREVTLIQKGTLISIYWMRRIDIAIAICLHIKYIQHTCGEHHHSDSKTAHFGFGSSAIRIQNAEHTTMQSKGMTL
jgi:hypothetical protein